MGKINWGRVVLCGLLTGMILGVLEAITLPLVGRDFLAALPSGALLPPWEGGSLPVFLFLSILWLVMGIWTMWLYAAIRPRYGPGPKTAAIAGLATVLLGVMVDCAWASVGLVPPATLVGPVAAGVPVLIIAAVVGAWPYKE